MRRYQIICTIEVEAENADEAVDTVYRSVGGIEADVVAHEDPELVESLKVLDEDDED